MGGQLIESDVGCFRFAVLDMADWKLTVTVSADKASFETFVEEVGDRLLQGLASSYGVQVGEDCTAEALAYAWENWDRIRVMGNPLGYLYRVGQTKARRGIFRTSPPPMITRPESPSGWYEPGLPDALAALTHKQRAAVTLVHGFGWTPTEVSRLWQVSATTVREHIEKGMARLRKHLGVEA